MADKIEVKVDKVESAKKILDYTITAMVENNASDLHFSPGVPPRMRKNGKLVNMTEKILTAEETSAVADLLMSINARDEVVGPTGDSDFAFSYNNLHRFRTNVARTQKGTTIALRYLPRRIPSMEALGLPARTIRNLVQMQKGGIILVTGPTGSGKTTTLTSIVDWINCTSDIHIITIEAPVEYEHEHKRSNVDQRDLPADSPSFGSALRAALRQDPDVIMVGEMRDLETISAAITAAETGHLVFSTLHTNSAAETINRIIDAFPQNQQEQIRIQLATSLSAVLSQRLIRGKTAKDESPLSSC
ncbi:MAG: PilT/PilU family type 4a pilus ATPase [Candidatus Buchananbacteria bacterium]